jgi:extracellular elastinolytic metalloproteinase
MLAADHSRYEGEHECTMWGAFARKGLGAGAGGFVDDFSVPLGC